MLGALQKYMPAADAFMGLLGPAQRQWLQDNIEHMAPFLQSKDGQAALLMYLEEFNNFVIAANVAKAPKA